MQITKGKISIRQVCMILILALASPSLRILPNFVAVISKQASWLASVIAIIPAVILVYIINALFKKYPDKGLDDVFKDVFGNVIGTIINVMFLLFFILFLALYVRYFSERFLQTILIATPIEYLTLVMLAFIYFVSRNGIEAFARTAEVLLLILTIVFFFIFFIVIPEIEIKNIYPLTYYDILPLLKSTIYPFALFSFFTYVMFLGDKITHKEQIKNIGVKVAIYLGIVAVIIMLVTVGVFGYELTSKFSIPYFITLKSIEFSGVIERVESIFIAIWVITDFAIIGMFAFITLNLFKKIFKLKSTVSAVSPLMILTYILSMYIASNMFELHDYSQSIAMASVVITGFLIPLTTLVVGKIRKKV